MAGRYRSVGCLRRKPRVEEKAASAFAGDCRGGEANCRPCADNETHSVLSPGEIVDIVGQSGCADRTRLPGWAGQPNLCRTGFSPQIRNSHAIRRPSRRACPRPTGQYRGEVAKPEIVANEFPAARHLDWRTFAVQRRDQQSLAIAIRLGNCATDGEGNLAVVRRDAKYTSIGSSDRCANIRNPDLSVHCPLT